MALLVLCEEVDGVSSRLDVAVSEKNSSNNTRGVEISSITHFLSAAAAAAIALEGKEGRREGRKGSASSRRPDRDEGLGRAHSAFIRLNSKVLNTLDGRDRSL